MFYDRCIRSITKLMNYYILRLIEDGTIEYLKKRWLPKHLRCEKDHTKVNGSAAESRRHQPQLDQPLGSDYFGSIPISPPSADPRPPTPPP